MTEAQRNSAVGLLVLVGFILLGWIILQFSNIAMLARGGYRVEVHLDHAAAAMTGKLVHFNGVEIGTVSDVRLAPDGKGVIVELRIDDGVSIPGNARLTMTSSGFGDAFLNFALPKDPGTGEYVEPAPPLATDGTARIEGATGGSGLLPQALTDRFETFLAKFDKLDVTLRNIADLTEPRSLEDVEAGRAAPNLAVAVARFDAAMSRIADEENTRHIKEVLTNLSEASLRFNETLKQTEDLLGKSSVAVAKISTDFDDIKENTDRLLNKLYDDAVKISNLLDTVNSLAKGVQEGEGTLGKLLKSDEFHRQLVLLVLEMQEAFKSMNRLVIKLEKEGLLRSGG